MLRKFLIVFAYKRENNMNFNLPTKTAKKKFCEKLIIVIYLLEYAKKYYFMEIK